MTGTPSSWTFSGRVPTRRLRYRWFLVRDGQVVGAFEDWYAAREAHGRIPGVALVDREDTGKTGELIERWLHEQSTADERRSKVHSNRTKHGRKGRSGGRPKTHA